MNHADWILPYFYGVAAGAFSAFLAGLACGRVFWRKIEHTPQPRDRG